MRSMNPDPLDNEEIRRFEEQYRRMPDSLVFARLADAYRKAGDPNRALEILEAGISRHREYASAHIVRARACLDLERTGAAEESFLRVLELDNANLVAMRGLAALARERGDLASARLWFQRISGLDPEKSAEPDVAEPDDVPAASLPPEPEPLPRTEEEWWTPDAEPAVEKAEPTPGGPAGAWWFEDPAEGGSAEDGDLLTRTMAELYEKQGLFEEAAAIYAELLSDRPDDDELRAALAQLETRLETVPEAAIHAEPTAAEPPFEAKPLAEPAAGSHVVAQREATSGRSEVFLAWLRKLAE